MHPSLYPVFDQGLSLRVDQCISALDRRPSWPRRLLLHLHKAWLEQRIPAFETKGGAQ